MRSLHSSAPLLIFYIGSATFSLAVLQIFLSPVSSSVWCFGALNSLGLSVWSVLNLVNLCVYYFCKIWGVSAIINCSFSTAFFILSFWQPKDLNPDFMLSFFKSLKFCPPHPAPALCAVCSDWSISSNLLSHSLFPLLCPFCCWTLPVNLFWLSHFWSKVSIGFFFISSISLLRCSVFSVSRVLWLLLWDSRNSCFTTFVRSVWRLLHLCVGDYQLSFPASWDALVFVCCVM